MVVKTCDRIKCFRMASTGDNYASSGSIQTMKLVFWATGWTIGVPGFDSRRGLGNFLSHHRVQNGSVAHPASYPMGTRGSLTGGKAAGA
jgi:hypothetical protein